MPLICQQLDRETLTDLNHKIHKLPIENSLHKEIMDGEVMVTEDNGYAIYHSAAGFYFLKIDTNLKDTLYKDIKDGRSYLCTAFELNINDPTLKTKLINRFQETYGYKYMKMIEYHSIKYNNALLMLVKFPSCVLRQMMAPAGGSLKTIISGDKESLKQIPTLVKLGHIQDSQNKSVSVFVTQYGKGMLDQATNMHYDIFREILSKPNLGLTIKSFMTWDA
jgi:hypothetical protein